MKKVILFSLLMIIGCVPAPAQNKIEQKSACALGLDQAPELRGFRLGMTQAAVLARLPGVTIEKPDNFGLARLRLSFMDSTSLLKTSTREKAVQPDAFSGEGSAFVLDSARFPAFKGVRKIQMRFIDGRLAHLQITYDDQIKWDSIDEFVDTISTNLKLPTQWQAPAESDGRQQKELRCEG